MLSNMQIKPIYAFILVKGVRSGFSFTALQLYSRGKYSKEKLTMRILKREKKEITESSKTPNASVGQLKNNALQLWDQT